MGLPLDMSLIFPGSDDVVEIPELLLKFFKCTDSAVTNKNKKDHGFTAKDDLLRYSKCKKAPRQSLASGLLRLPA
jgi:hypothetical protein